MPKQDLIISSSSQALTHHHVLVVVTGALLLFAPSAFVFNTWSIFVVPVSNAMDAPSSAFTLTASIIFFGAAIMAPFAGNLMERFDLRIILSASVFCCGLGIFLNAFWTEMWQFYISAALEGVGVVSLTYLGPPTLVNRWFTSHMGLLVGICVAMAGAGGALWCMVGGVIIAQAGYQLTYIVFGLALWVIGLPGPLFFIRSYPDEIGLKPYSGKPRKKTRSKTNRSVLAGHRASRKSTRPSPSIREDKELISEVVIEEEQELAPDAYAQGQRWGVSAKTAFRSPVFYTLAATFALFNGTGQAGNLFPTYLYYLNDAGVLVMSSAASVIAASTVAMCMQVAQAGAKVGLGWIGDRSLRSALMIACGAGISGTLCCWIGSSESLLFGGSLLFGILYGATNVLGPTVTGYLFGSREYTRIYSRIAICVNLAPAIAATVFAALADISWNLMFGVVLAIIFLTMVLSLITLRLGRKLEKLFEKTPSP